MRLSNYFFSIIFLIVANLTAEEGLYTARPLTVDSASWLVWEAEWVNRLTGTYELLPDNKCSGNAALWTREGTGRHNGDSCTELPKNPAIEMGLAEYGFYVACPGDYSLFMRIRALDACSNSCWFIRKPLGVSPLWK